MRILHLGDGREVLRKVGKRKQLAAFTGLGTRGRECPVVAEGQAGRRGSRGLRTRSEPQSKWSCGGRGALSSNSSAWVELWGRGWTSPGSGSGSCLGLCYLHLSGKGVAGSPRQLGHGSDAVRVCVCVYTYACVCMHTGFSLPPKPPADPSLSSLIRRGGN